MPLLPDRYVEPFRIYRTARASDDPAHENYFADPFIREATDYGEPALARAGVTIATGDAYVQENRSNIYRKTSTIDIAGISFFNLYFIVRNIDNEIPDIDFAGIADEDRFFVWRLKELPRILTRHTIVYLRKFPDGALQFYTVDEREGQKDKFIGMSTFSVDGNFKPTSIRRSGVIGAKIVGTDTDSGWYRLVPDGIGAMRSSMNQVDLVAFRADVENVDFSSWLLHLANPGYEGVREVFSSDGTVLTVSPPFDFDGNAPIDEVYYVLFPSFLNDLSVKFDDGGSGILELAHSPQFFAPGFTGYSREVVMGAMLTPTLFTFASLVPGGSGVVIPSAAVENIFYRFSVASVDNKLFWGGAKDNMSTYTADKNFKTTKLRADGIVAFGLAGTAADSGWYRLAPDGVTASREEGDFLNVVLNNIRADVDGADFRGWLLRIANDGFHQSRRIIAVDGNVVTLDVPLFAESKIDASITLPLVGIQYILIPHMLRDLNAYFDGLGSGVCTIGYSTRFLQPGVTGYSREVITGLVETPTIHDLGELAIGKNVKVPIADVDSLFYKFSDASVDNRIYWGEQEIVAQGGAGGGAAFVDVLPDVNDARFNLLYVLGYRSFWRKFTEIAPGSPGVITSAAFDTVATGYSYLGEFDAVEPSDVAAIYLDKRPDENFGFYQKATGLWSGVGSHILPTIPGATWLIPAATNPTVDATKLEFYYNTTDHEIRQHPIGNSTWTQVNFSDVNWNSDGFGNSVWFGPASVGGNRIVANTEHVDTLREFIIARLDPAGGYLTDYSVSHETYYYNTALNHVYRVVGPFTEPPNYTKITAAVATGVATSVLLPHTVNSEAGAIANLDENYVSTNSYIYFDATDDDLLDIDAFTATVDPVPRDILVQISSAFVMGPLENAFTTTALRNTYATANADWLALYDGNSAFVVSVTVSGVVTYYRRNGGAWEAVNGLIGIAASQSAINTAVAAAVAAAVINFRTGAEITTEIDAAIVAGVDGLQNATQVADAITTALSNYLTQSEITALILSTETERYDYIVERMVVTGATPGGSQVTINAGTPTQFDVGFTNQEIFLPAISKDCCLAFRLDLNKATVFGLDA